MNEGLNVDLNNPGATIYVNQNATGSGDGSSWENAYTDLQPALRASQPNDQVWVAAGTYFPTSDEDRSQSFVIKDRVKVYGGFAGGETDLSQRDLLANPTTLSGNIGNPEDAEDNSNSVVDISNTSSFFTVFDGFRVVDGYNPVITLLGGGGGIYAREGNADLRNLILANNSAERGGAIYAFESTLSLNNVVFIGNFASIEGGAVSTFASEGEINNALFIDNQSETGGAINFSVSGNGFNLNNNTFYNNEAVSGAVLSTNFSVNIRNSIFRANTAGDEVQFVDPDGELRINNSLVQNGSENLGEGNINEDPLFVDPDNLNFGLQSGSPGIDAGNNAVVEGIETDLVGNARITNDTVDLGAYEFVLAQEDINENPNSETPPEETPDTPPENNPDSVEGDPVYRFFIPDTGVHFYTADEAERNSTLETQPDYVLEGTPYNSAPANDSLTGVAPVYRFLNTDTGIRIYTISEPERESIETLPNYQPEGIAYYGYTEQSENTAPVFRFYNPVIDAHFYTSSTVERDSVLENLPDYQLESNEGIAFYVEPLNESDTITPPPETAMDSTASAELSGILNNLVVGIDN